jgi:hypothetical protein
MLNQKKAQKIKVFYLYEFLMLSSKICSNITHFNAF